MKTYQADNPAATPDKDEFQRAVFARRLAHTLLVPSTGGSIVVGLYGKWGEGKSSVLNFVEHELTQATPIPAIIHLNPWRFPDEKQLLLDFFAQLIKKLGKELNTKGEKFARNVTSYIAPIIPGDLGKGLEAIGKVAEPTIEELYARVDAAISNSKRRVVVIVDDLDRLEKQQIQAVFRLIKLTANFRSTAYLLAFDEVMVARAIGEIFAAGADAAGADPLSAGQSFLEKIVQVPLRLPRARPQDLLAYGLARLEEALADIGIKLDSEAGYQRGDKPNRQHFTTVFRQGVLPRLTTPRLAIRYANTVRFSLPLLQGEINTVDLLLIEALNVFYPELHQLIAARQNVFAGSGKPNRMRNLGGGPDVNIELEGLLTSFFTQHHYSPESSSAARIILRALFPLLAMQADEWAHWNNARAGMSEAELNRLQAVAAPAYFSRYFSYSVASGDVADQEFNAFVQSLGSEQIGLLRSFSRRISTTVVLDRLTYRLPDFTGEQSRSLFTSLSAAADLLPPPWNWDAVHTGELTQAVTLLLQLLEKLPDLEARQQLAQQVLRAGGHYELAYQIDQQLQQRYRAEQQSGPHGEPSRLPPLFSAAGWASYLAAAGRLLLERALQEAGSEPLYRSHPTYALRLLTTIWPSLDLPPGPVVYLLPYLQRNPTEVQAFLWACGQRASATGVAFYRAGLGVKDFDLLRDTFGQPLYELVREQFGTETVERVEFGETAEPIPRQRLGQFIYLYEHRPASSELEAAEPPPSHDGSEVMPIVPD